MSIYAIGDIQGCYRTLTKLLEKIDPDPARDRLWIAGDLVNRGPASAKVLRFARDNQNFVKVVLGNHDLHLLTVGYGITTARPKDTFDDVLAAPDRDELLEWLARRPFLRRKGKYVMVHAGLLPAWTVDEIEDYARAASRALRGPKRTDLLSILAEKREVKWKDSLTGTARHEVVARCLCNLRICKRNGQPLLSFAGSPEEAPAKTMPWYDVPDRRNVGSVVVCGHWAAQGLRLRKDLIALDSGCVWGNQLTAVRLDDRKVFQVPLRDRLADPQWARRVGPGPRKS